MLPVMTEVFGNPSSIHHYGQAARAKLDDARRQIAAMLHCFDTEIVFTSGGTEADNLAILGLGGHVITDVLSSHPEHGLQHCDRCGASLRRTIIGGRSTYHCARCQRAPRARVGR